MSADQIAEISPLIRELLDHSSLRSVGGGDLCATFEVVGVPDAWAQVTSTNLNVAYPFAHSPDDEVRRIVQNLPGAQLTSWDAGRYATWSFASTDPIAVATVVDEVLSHLFQLGDYAVDALVEQL